MRVKRARMSTQLIVTYILAAVLPLAAFTLASTYLAQQYYQQVVRRGIETSMYGMAAAVEEKLDGYSKRIDALANSDVILGILESPRGQDRQVEYEALAAGFSRDEKIMLHLLTPDNSYRYSTGYLPNLYSMPVYKDFGVFAKANQQPNHTLVISNKFSVGGGDQVSISLVRAVQHQQEIIAYIVVDVLRSDIMELTRLYEPDSSQNMLWVDQDNRVVFYLDYPQMEGITLRDAQMQEIVNLQRLQGSYHQRIKNTNYMAIPAGEFEFTLVNQVSLQGMQTMSDITLRVAAGVSIITALLALCLGIMFSVRMRRPMERLTQAFNRNKTGDLAQHFDIKPHDYCEIQQLGENYNDLVDKLAVVLATNVEKQRLLDLAEFKSLQSQIKPHFFYNILNDIKSLAKLGRNEDISVLVVALANVLRGNLNTGDEFLPVRRELSLVEDYITLQNVRHDNGIRYELRLDIDPDAYVIPRCILQPLVENAIVHGMRSQKRCQISITGRKEGEHLVFCVEDNGVGIGGGDKRLSAYEERLHSGIGLENINKRLQLHYGPDHQLEIDSVVGQYTKILVKFDINT